MDESLGWTVCYHPTFDNSRCCRFPLLRLLLPRFVVARIRARLVKRNDYYLGHRSDVRCTSGEFRRFSIFARRRNLGIR